MSLVLALGAGLPLGKEGPCVHISCCVVSAMFRLPGFRSIRRSKPLRLQMLAVGCAVGVSSTFGAPIGGVLFSIEVTATYFLVPLYWRCFFASTPRMPRARPLRPETSPQRAPAARSLRPACSRAPSANLTMVHSCRRHATWMAAVQL